MTAEVSGHGGRGDQDDHGHPAPYGGRGRVRAGTHEGYEWLYVLAGRMRLLLADHDITVEPGEVAEFDTRLPHWFGPAGDQSVEILSRLGRQDEHIHVPATPRRMDNSS